MPSPTDIVWHVLQPSGPTAEVPDMIEDTADLVKEYLAQSKEWAQQSIDETHDTIAALTAAKGPTELPAPPDAPTINTNLTASFNLGLGSLPYLGDIQPGYIPDTFTPPVTIDALPNIQDLGPYVPLITGLSIPDAPQFVLPTAPNAPAIDVAFDLPASPVAGYGLPPDIVDLALPTYVPPTLPIFNDAEPAEPELPPDPFIQWTEPQYTSAVKDAIQGVLTTMLAGGTGLDPAVERAIWERAREREDITTLRTINEALTTWTARGYTHPPGQLNAQVLTVQDDSARKQNELSREQAVAQAELEQKNRQFAVAQGIAFEQVYVGIFLAIVDRNFQIAKFAVETQIQLYNQKVALFNARVSLFGLRVEKFKAQLEAAFATIKAFEAQVMAAKAAGELEAVRAQVYAEKVRAFGTQVEAYKALITAAEAKAGLQKLKVDIYGQQIAAHVASINGKRAEFEAYASRVQGESAKAQLEEAHARSYLAQVQGVAAKADVAIKKTDAQIAQNKLYLEYSIADVQRSTQITQQQLAAIQVRATAYEASLKRDTAAFEADKSLKVVQLQTNIELGKLAVAKYGAMLEAWKARATQVLAAANITSESLRAAGQIASTLAAGAMAGTHVQAGISGSASAGQSKTESSAKSQAFNQSTSDSNAYSVIHNYNHEA
jgi:hypothetical protein